MAQRSILLGICSLKVIWTYPWHQSQAPLSSPSVHLVVSVCHPRLLLLPLLLCLCCSRLGVSSSRTLAPRDVSSLATSKLHLAILVYRLWMHKDEWEKLSKPLFLTCKCMGKVITQNNWLSLVLNLRIDPKRRSPHWLKYTCLYMKTSHKTNE